MDAKKRRIRLQEAKERLEARDSHVATLVKRNERASEREERKECARRHKQRTMEINQEDAMSARSKLLEARRQSRINSGLPPDISPLENLRCMRTKLSVRRAAIKAILQEHNPRATQ